MTTDADSGGLCVLAESLAAPGQPATLFARFDRAIAEVFGRIFTTVLLVREDGDGDRVFSSDHAAYPVPHRKPFPGSGWGEQVLVRGEPLLVRTMEEYLRVFPGRVVFEGLGCGCLANLPVVHDGRVLGSVNIGHRALAYDAATVARMMPFATLLGPSLALLRRAAR